MRHPRPKLAARIATLSLALALGGCGGKVSRFHPALPAVPEGLTAAAGTRQVSLAWFKAADARVYDVYLSTSSRISGVAASKVASIATTSLTLTALEGGTPYYFYVTARNLTGESAPSNEVSATPAAATTYAQGDATGTWRFNVLAAGAAPGWARGTLQVNDAGAVSFVDYQDGVGATAAPPGFMPNLLVGPEGEVRDASGAPAFTGLLGGNKRFVVATASFGGTRSLAVLLRHDPARSFEAGAGAGTDISGFGGAAGARRVIYDQITSGNAPQEWEFAAGQIGQTPQIQYSSGSGGAIALPYLAPSNPPKPDWKDTTFAIDAAGVVTETVAAPGVSVQPVFLLTQGYMSDDRALIVGVGLRPSPSPPAGFSASGRYALRIYHVTNVNSSSSAADTITGVTADLAGSWRFRKLVVGLGALPAESALTATGTLSIDTAGAATFSSYADDLGGSAPSGFTLTMLSPDLGTTPAGAVTQYWGSVVNAADPTLHGKLSYGKDLLVLTRSEATGGSSFLIALR